MTVHGGAAGIVMPFSAQITGIEQPLESVVLDGQAPGLPQHRVDQGRLAMVDVGHDRDVAETHAGDCRSAMH
jgi:hypothetical protein